jgi:hypothetical protein
VGNAPAMSKRSVMFAAVFANIPWRQTVRPKIRKVLEGCRAPVALQDVDIQYVVCRRCVEFLGFVNRSSRKPTARRPGSFPPSSQPAICSGGHLSRAGRQRRFVTLDLLRSALHAACAIDRLRRREREPRQERLAVGSPVGRRRVAGTTTAQARPGPPSVQ